MAQNPNPIPTYFNPEIGPSYNGLSFEDVANSFNNGQQFSNQIQEQQQKGLLSRLLAQSTGQDGKVDLNKALETVQSNPNQAYQPALVNTLSGLIQQQKANEIKAQQEALKSDADLNKTYAETGKIKQEGINKGLENGTIRDGAINDVFQAAALTGSKNIVLLGLNAKHKSGLMDDDTYNQQVQLVNTMTPSQIQEYARGNGLGNKEVAPYLFQTANNRADNATSRANNTATVGATMRGQDITAQTAAAKLAQDKILADQERAFKNGEVKTIMQGIDGKSYVVYNSGHVELSRLPNGEPISLQPKNGGQMSAGAQKQLFETTDAITAGNNAISNLTDALKYSQQAYDGLGASQRAYTRGMIGGGSDEATATAMLDNITKGNALDQLKATFGGAPTEGERAILLQLQGSANMPRAQREAIYRRALELAQARLAANQAKAESLRNGSFFKAAQTDNDQGQNLFGLFD